MLGMLQPVPSPACLVGYVTDGIRFCRIFSSLGKRNVTKLQSSIGACILCISTRTMTALSMNRNLNQQDWSLLRTGGPKSATGMDAPLLRAGSVHPAQYPGETDGSSQPLVPIAALGGCLVLGERPR